MNVSKAADKLNYLSLLFLSFLFFYAFNLPGVGNSAYVGLLLIAFLLTTSNAAFNRFILLTSSSIFKIGAIAYLVYIALAVLSASINQSFDFTILPTLINNLLSLIGVTGLVALLHNNRVEKGNTASQQVSKSASQQVSKSASQQVI